MFTSSGHADRTTQDWFWKQQGALRLGAWNGESLKEGETGMAEFTDGLSERPF